MTISHVTLQRLEGKVDRVLAAQDSFNTLISTEKMLATTPSRVEPKLVTIPPKPDNLSAEMLRHFTPSSVLFQDSFTGLDPDKWRVEKMKGALHRAGNELVDSKGNVLPAKRSQPGCRHSARYDGDIDKMLSFGPFGMGMQGYVTPDKNLMRKNLEHNGVVHSYGDNTINTVWLDHWTRKWGGDDVGHITDPDSPDIHVKPNSVISATVNFSAMCVPGHRSSLWLMPSKKNASNAYDADPKDVEVDLWEFCPGQPHLLQCKILGGKAGNTAGGSVDMRKFGIDLTLGWHTISFLWLPDVVMWFVDGILVLQDRIRVPSVEHYLCLSREACSGFVKNAKHPGQIQAQPPFNPRDPGLYLDSVILSMDKFEQDIMYISDLTVQEAFAA